MEHDHAVYSHVQTGYTYVSGDDDKDTSHTQYTVDIIGTGGELHLVGYDWAPHGVDMNTKEHPKYERYAVDPGTYLWEGGGSYVAECLLSGKPSLITPEHGLHVLEVMNAALESGTTGRRVKVESTFKWPLFAA